VLLFSQLPNHREPIQFQAQTQSENRGSAMEGRRAKRTLPWLNALPAKGTDTSVEHAQAPELS